MAPIKVNARTPIAVPSQKFVAVVLAMLILAALDPSPGRSLADAVRHDVRKAEHALPSATLAPPDISGPGKVLTAGRVHMKVTNFGVIGNPFTNLSSDPSGQWPESSGIEYLNAITLAVGAVDPTASDPAQRHRVSYSTEWRPPSLAPEDRIYATFENMTNGVRFVNDDGDVEPNDPDHPPRIDEDPLDGRDNDLDGLIDEDYDARGWQEFSCVMRDDSQEALQAEPGYVPLGLECRQLGWAYGIVGYSDFNVVEYTFVNRSGHALDSVYVGWRVDMDAGPTSTANYFQDDLDLPGFASGQFTIRVGGAAGDLNDPARRQFPHDPALNPYVPPDSALCPRLDLRLNGFAVCDDNGDAGTTPGVAGFFLVHHTLDPIGINGPARVGFRAFRSFSAGTPFANGGGPLTDDERYQFMSGTDNVDPSSGFIDVAPGTTPADYVQWCSIGPFRNVPAGGHVEATIVFAVQPGDHTTGLQYPADYASYRSGAMSPDALRGKYPLLTLALDVQRGYEGFHELRGGYLETKPPAEGGRDSHGRETAIRLPAGVPPQLFVEDCSAEGRERREVIVNDQQYSWFDFDCDLCTGIWDYPMGRGLFHHTWAVAAGPLSVDARPSGVLQLAPLPNPALERSTIELDLAAESDVRASIYDLSGRLIRVVASGRFGAGRHEIAWNLRDRSGRRVQPGLYLWRASVGERRFAGRVAVVQ